MRRLGTELRVPLVDMHAHLRSSRDTGFLWWDQVHLTSYGQRLFADKLYGEIMKL